MYSVLSTLLNGKRSLYILYVQEVVTPVNKVSYCIKWVTTSWTYSMYILIYFQELPAELRAAIEAAAAGVGAQE